MSILVTHFTVVGVCTQIYSEITEDDLRQLSNAVFMLFTIYGVTMSINKTRFAIALKREDFKDVRQNPT